MLTAAQGRMLWNSAWHQGSARRLWTVLGAVAAVAALVAAEPLSARAEAQTLPRSAVLLQPLLAGGVAMLMAFTFVTSLGFVLAAGYFAKDIEWLLSRPVSPRAFLAHRLLGQLGLGAAVGVALLAPPAVAAAVRFGALWSLVVVGLALLGAALAPMALALVSTVALVRVLPPARVRDGLGVIIALGGFAVAGVNIALRAGGLGSAPAGGLGLGTLGRGPASSALLPTGWAARAITAAWTGHPAAAAAWTAVLLGTGLVAVGLALLVSGPLFLRGWAAAQAAGRGRAGRPRTRRLRVRAPWRAILVKDARVIRRDLVQVVQLLLPVALFGIYIVVPGGGSRFELVAGLPSWFGSLTTAVFAALFVASGIGLRGVGAEGRQFWLLRVAPTGVRDLLAAKTGLAVLVATTVGTALLWAGELRQGTTAGALLYSTAILAPLVAGLAAAATGIGAVWPRFGWTDPRRAVSLWLGIGFLVAGAVYLGVILGTIALTFVTGALSALTAGLVAWLSCCVWAGCIGGICLWLGARRLHTVQL
ncbi:MAG TPA: hypothetical protein VMW49_02005 [Candidatus Dormibacteraeota bacterium]|nr:hypothetical protein [Candidatus Dormibacteraeota bacterium]